MVSFLRSSEPMEFRPRPTFALQFAHISRFCCTGTEQSRLRPSQIPSRFCDFISERACSRHLALQIEMVGSPTLALELVFPVYRLNSHFLLLRLYLSNRTQRRRLFWLKRSVNSASSAPKYTAVVLRISAQKVRSSISLPLEPSADTKSSSIDGQST